MAKVRVIVGTHKGAFLLTSDEKRERWNIDGPHFGGWEIYHAKGTPADPDRLYVSQSTGWFGQVMQRSDDGGKTWEPVGNEFAYKGTPGTHKWYDGSQHPWEFKRVWYLEPSPTDSASACASVTSPVSSLLMPASTMMVCPCTWKRKRWILMILSAST